MTGANMPFNSDKSLSERVDINFALKAAGLGVWELDSDTKQVNWDDRCCELFGLPPTNQLPYEQAIRQIHPDDRALVQQAVRWATNPQSGGGLDVTFRSSGVNNGVQRWVRFMGQAYFSETGELARFAGVAQPVDNRYQRQQLALLVENAPEFMATMGLDGRMQFINGYGQTLFGLNPDQVTTKWLTDFVPPEELSRVTTEILPSVMNGNWSGAIVLMQPDTEVRIPVFCDAYLLTDSVSGKPYGIAGVVRDRRQELEAHQTLIESEALLRSVIAAAPAAIGLLIGPDHILENPNQTFIDILGKGPGITGKPLGEAMPELITENQPFLRILDEVYTSGLPFQAFDTPIDIIKNGVLTRGYFNFSYTPLFDIDGNVYAILDIATDVTERVLTQQRLEDSQRQLLALFEQSPVGIAILDEDNLTFRMANSFYGELVGRHPGQLLGKPLLKALPELSGQGFDDLLRQVITTGIPYVATEAAVALVRQNQLETIYVDLTYQPQREVDTGRISGILVVATDVTQQVRARQKVEVSEAKLRSVIATAPAGMGLFVGRELRVEMPNQTFIDIVGKGPDIEGKPLREVMPELVTEDQPFLKILDEVYTSGKMYQSFGAQVNIVQQGVMTHNFYNITYTPLRDESGQVYGILDIAIDVTQQILAQQQLAESEERFRSLATQAPLVVFMADVNANVQYWNQWWLDFSGQTEEQALGRSWESMIHPQDVDRLLQGYLAATQKQTSYSIEARVKRWDGVYRYILFTGGPRYSVDGDYLGIVGTGLDIDDRKQFEQALQESEARYRTLSAELDLQVQQRTQELQLINSELASTNEEYAAMNEELDEANQLLTRSNNNLQQFAYVASHDLQEPLRKVQSFGDLLKTQYGVQLGEGTVYLERMQLAANRMSTLIKDLLSFSRISTRRDTNRSVSLTQVVQEVVMDLELVIQETGAQVLIDPLPSVLGDPSQLGQLFQNLLSNAVKFRQPDILPQIHFSSRTVLASDLPVLAKPARTTKAYYQIDVTDNGVGFEEKYLDRIFQVFQRLHGKNKYAGTGIGLAICEKVVANHGGAITATSRLGHGSTFHVFLPVLT